MFAEYIAAESFQLARPPGQYDAVVRIRTVHRSVPDFTTAVTVIDTDSGAVGARTVVNGWRFAVTINVFNVQNITSNNKIIVINLSTGAQIGVANQVPPVTHH